MVALRLTARVTAHRILIGCFVNDGGLVVGVAGTGGGQLGQHGLHGRAQLRGQHAADARHPVEFLLAQHDPALAGPLLVAKFPVGVEPVHDPLGVCGQLVGAILAGFAGQVGFGGFPGTQVYLGGQVGEEAADHPHMPVTDEPVALSGRGRGQLRRQRLTGQRPPLTKISCLVDAPARLGLGDAQPVGQRRTQFGAQFFLAGLRAELIDQRVLGCPQPSCHALQALQGPQPFRGGEHVKRQLAQTIQI
ncbi:hypothetical protein LAUMK21_05819 [Mycobacterium pseudokansasii]|nr:hypothetical protein LAUMK21_05819 [Mycobacterium pseudokansasii]